MCVSDTMTEELFQQWFDSIFLRCCSATRPLILVLDNREAFYNDNLQAMAAQKQVRACVRHCVVKKYCFRQHNVQLMIGVLVCTLRDVDSTISLYASRL